MDEFDPSQNDDASDSKFVEMIVEHSRTAKRSIQKVYYQKDSTLLRQIIIIVIIDHQLTIHYS